MTEVGMAYLLGFVRKQPLVQGASGSVVVGESDSPRLRYVLLDAISKRPVPDQQLRRKGQALQIWVNGELVQELPTFFANTAETLFPDLKLTELLMSVGETSPSSEEDLLSEQADESWQVQATLPLPDLDIHPSSWRESDLWAKANPTSAEPTPTTDVTTQVNPALVNSVVGAGQAGTAVSGSVAGLGLGAAGVLAGIGAVGSHVNDKVSGKPGNSAGAGGGGAGGGGAGGGGAGGGGGVASNNGNGAFTAGPAVAGNGLHLMVYRADTGALLEDVKVQDDGTYSFTTTYAGVVILVVHDVDADPNNPSMDYMDEAGGLVDLAVDLRSIAVLSAAGGSVTANVTPLTEIAATLATGKSAAQAASAGYAEATLTPAAVVNTNKALAKMLGLGDNMDVTSASVTPTTNADGSANSSSNNYGRVLAALSHAGDLANVIGTMAAGIQVNSNGTATFSGDGGSAAQVLMAQGMTEAEAAQGISFANMPALQTVKTEAVNAYSSVLISNMLKQADLLGTDLSTQLTAAKAAQTTQSTQWNTLSTEWASNSALNKDSAFFNAISSSKGNFDNALGQAFNKSLAQATAAQQLLGNANLNQVTRDKAQAAYDQAVLSLKLQAQTVLDRVTLDGLKQDDMTADWTNGDAAALTRLNTSLNQLSHEYDLDASMALAWQTTLTQLTTAQKTWTSLKASSSTSSTDLVTAQAMVSKSKDTVSLVESSSADQAAADLAAWKLLALRRQAYLDNPNDAAKQAAWMEALATEATQVQGDQVITNMLSTALHYDGTASDKQTLVKEALLTVANRACTDRVFANALSEALDQRVVLDIDKLQQLAADKAAVDQLLLDMLTSQSEDRIASLQHVMAAQAASEKLAALNWEKKGADVDSGAFRSLEAQNKANNGLLHMLKDAFDKEDAANSTLNVDPTDAQARKDLVSASAIQEAVVNSFSQQALFQVQSVMAKVLRLDEKPDSTVYNSDGEALNPAQTTVTLGLPDIAQLNWSLVYDERYPDSEYFNLKSSGELTFKKGMDYENSTTKLFQLLVRMQDAEGASADQVITVNLGNVNEAPTAEAALANKTIAKDSSFSLATSSAFEDVDANDALIFTAENLPAGLSISNQGVISGTPTNTQAASSIKVTATDALGLSVSQTFSLTVADAPSMQGVTPAANSKTLVKQGDTVEVVVSTSEAINITGNGTPNLLVTFNNINLEANFVSADAPNKTMTFSFMAPAKSVNGALNATDGDSLSVTGLKLNNSILVGSTTGLAIKNAPGTPLNTTAITLDNTAPVTPELQLDDKGYDNADGLTQATVVKVLGIEANATWQYSLDNGQNWTTGANLPNNLRPGFALGNEGNYALGSIQVRQTDQVGNISPTGSSSSTWTIDNTQPTVALSSNKINLKIGETATLTLVFSEVPSQLPSVSPDAGTLSVWTASIDKKTYTATYTPPINFEGSPTFTVGAWSDKAGNAGSTSSMASVVIDTNPPPAPSMSLQDTGSDSRDGVTNITNITVSGLENGATWQYSVDSGVQWGNGTGASFNLPQGSYAQGAVLVRQTDAAGNNSVVSASPQQWSIDTTAPTVSVNNVTADNILNLKEYEAGVSVSGQSNNANVGDAVSVQWGHTTLNTTAGVGGVWVVGFTQAQLPSGEVPSTTINVTITDLAGNTSTTSKTVGVDTVAPSITLPTNTMPSTNLSGWAMNLDGAVVDNILNKYELDTITADDKWTLSGTTTAEAGQAITLTINQSIFKGTVAEGSNGSNIWTVAQSSTNDVASALANLSHGNTYKIKVQSQDNAGNVSEAVESALLVKLYPPDVPTVYELKTNSFTPTIKGQALKDTNTTNMLGENIYSNLEDGDVLSVTVFGHTFNLTLPATQDSDGPLSYNRATHEWQLDLSNYKDSHGDVIQLNAADGQFNVQVEVLAVGYAQAMTDRSINEVLINTTSPTITWNSVTSDNTVNASETNSAVTLSGTVNDNMTGSDVNWAVYQDLTITMGSGVDAKTWNTQVGTDGTWKVQLTTSQAQALAQGTATVTASMSSVFGNSASESHTFQVDTVAPALRLTTPPDVNLSANETASWQTALLTNDATSGLQNVDVHLYQGSIEQTSNPISIQKNGDVVTGLGGDLSTLADGNYTVQVSATDNAGNASAVNLQLQIDQTAPTVTFSINKSQLLKNETATVTMQLSEALSGLPVLNPSVGQLSSWVATPNNGLQYTATFTPPADQNLTTLTWTMGSATWTDMAGNAGTNSTLPGTAFIDTKSPTINGIALVNALNKPLKATDTVVIEVSFSEDVTVTGSPALSLMVGSNAKTATYLGVKTVNNAAVPNVHLWRYTIQAGDNDSDGISIGANALSLGVNDAVKDNLGNAAVLSHLAPNLTQVVVDTTAPTVSLSLNQGADTLLASGETAIINAVFSEAPKVLPSLTVTNGTVPNGTEGTWVKVNDTHYTTTFTPNANVISGNVPFSLSEWTDAAGNAGSATNQAIDLGVDTVAPSVMGFTDHTAADVTNASVIFDITLSEAINGTWAASNFSAANGTVDAVAYNAQTKTVSVTVTPTANVEGTMTLTLQSSTFKDAAGNALNLQLASASQLVDTHAPTVTNVALSGSPDKVGVYKVGETIYATVTLSEDVVLTGNKPTFDLNVGGQTRQATYDAQKSTSDTLVFGYQIASPTLTASDNDTDGVSVSANALKLSLGAAVKDAAGNSANLSHDGLASNLQFKVDSEAPTVVISATRTQLNLEHRSDDVTFTFSEDPGTSFSKSDISVEGGTLSDFIKLNVPGMFKYTATFTLNASFSGTAKVSVANGQFQDLAGNSNNDGNANAKIWDADTGAPQVAMDAAKLGSNGTAVVTIDEAGTVYLVLDGVDVTDSSSIATQAAKSISFTNAQATDTQNLSVQNLADGVYWAYGVDSLGNLSSKSANSITVDNTAPTIGGGASASVLENVLSNTVVYETGASDTNSLVYALKTVDDYASFSINPAGQVRITTSPNFENKNSYSFTVQVSDGVNITEQAVTLSVTNVNEAPTGTDKTITLNEDSSYTFSASDFGFSDATGETGRLKAVNITSLPTSGSLIFSNVVVQSTVSIDAADLNNLVFTPAANANGNSYASFKFTVQDNGGTANGGADTSLAKTITFNVTPVNDAPLLTSNSTLSYTENQAATAINSTITVSDADNTTLASGMVSITAGFDANQDVLSFTNNAATMGNISGSYNATTGVMTLSSLGGTASLAQWQAALRAITYYNTSDNPSTAARTVSYLVNDGAVDAIAVTSTINITGTNDAAVITGDTSKSLTETNAALTTSGNLSATDVDSSNVFTAQTDAAGSNGYGKFSISTQGAWTYTMNNAQNQFVAGTNYTDAITVSTADGTTQTVTVTITGTNDAAVITGDTSKSLTETNAALTTSGNLSATDVDSSNVFTAQTDAAGSNGYGKFSITTQGAWTYTMNNAQNQFVAGTNYTDAITVSTADGTTQTVTVTITGTNDAAVITGDTSKSLTETNTALTTSGNLSATDVDSSNVFTAQTDAAGSNGYGKFSITTQGAWTYTMNNAQNQFVAGTNYTDAITVSTADGTTQTVTVTITGTNDAAVITGDTSKSLTETNAVLTTSGNLSATDVDSSNVFTAQTNAAGSNGYGKFSITTQGAWTYTMNNAQNQFVAGTNYTDAITVSTADGTAQTVTVTITGTNDAPVLATPNAINLSDSSAVDAFANVTSTLSATDPDAASLTYTLNGTPSEENNTIGGVTYTRKQQGSYGVLYFLPTKAAYVYVPNATQINGLASGISATDSFVFSVSDGALTDTQTLTVNLTGANDYATVTNNAIRVNMGTSIPTSVSSLNTSITSRILTLSDFGLSDAEGNTSASIQFTSLPGSGSLTLNGVAVVANQTVSWTDIVSGNLSYLTGSAPSGSSYANIGFKVQDGAYTSSVKALTLNGTTEYLDVGALTAANGKLISNQVTLEAWVKFSVYETHARIFDLSSGASTNNIILTENYFRIHNGGTSTGDAYFSITVGQWSHVAAIIDGTAMSVYINGELVGSGTLYGGQTLDRSLLSTPLSNDRTQNWIGRSAWSDPFADLSVYDARIYNDVRTQAEILQDMQGLTTANDPNLLKRLTLDGTTDGLGGATRTVSLGTLPSANYTDNPNTLVVHVDAQAVSLTGTVNADTLTAAAGNDSVQGLAGNDALAGGIGNDTLNGGNGNDTLNAHEGADLLIGGPGSDSLSGWSGADTFQWLAGDAFDPSTAAVPVVGGVTTPYTDTVNDFTLQQGDKIDLKGLLADTFQTHGVNASNISANIANYVNLSQSGTSTTALIKVDLDGAGNFVSPELTISLTNAWAANNLYSTWTLQTLMNSKVLVVI